MLGMLAACTSATSSPTVARGQMVTFRGASGDAVLQVAVAGTPDERAQGLMGVTKLPEDHGMAFVYDEPSTGTFWMKDTLIPLSIAFVGADGRIVTIREMTPCEADPCPTYGADAPYVLAVEADAGWYDSNGIAVGDRAELGEAIRS